MTPPQRPGTSTRRPRDLGPLSTAARLVVGPVLLGLAIADGPRPVDLLLGLVVANGIVFVAFGARGRTAPPLRFTCPAGHLINIALIVAFYMLNSTVANLFYGSAMLLAAARGYAACEMFAVWNWLRRRDDQFGCPVFLPVDLVDRHLWPRPEAC